MPIFNFGELPDLLLCLGVFLKKMSMRHGAGIKSFIPKNAVSSNHLTRSPKKYLLLVDLNNYFTITVPVIVG